MLKKKAAFFNCESKCSQHLKPKSKHGGPSSLIQRGGLFQKQKLQNRSRFYIVRTLFSFLSFPLSPLLRPSNMEKKFKSLTLNDRQGKESPPQISPHWSGEGLAPKLIISPSSILDIGKIRRPFSQIDRGTGGKQVSEAASSEMCP